jgi:acyl carrier protein
MTVDAIESVIRNFIVEHFPLAKKIDNQSSLLGNGLLDSLGILEVVEFLEQHFQIPVGDDDLTAENFQSIQTLSAFVRRRSQENALTPGE